MPLCCYSLPAKDNKNEPVGIYFYHKTCQNDAGASQIDSEIQTIYGVDCKRNLIFILSLDLHVSRTWALCSLFEPPLD